MKGFNNKQSTTTTTFLLGIFIIIHLKVDFNTFFSKNPIKSEFRHNPQIMGGITVQFYERLVQLIKDKNISKKKFLEDMELSKNSISVWAERGTLPSGDTIYKIADYFNVSVDYLLGRDEYEVKQLYPDVSDPQMLKTLAALKNDQVTMDLIKGCTYEEIQQAMAVVEALRKTKGAD